MTLIVVAVIVVPEMTLLVHRGRRRTPWGIARRLQVPGDTHTVVVRWFDYAALWNPGRPLGRTNVNFGGPGTAVYRMLPDETVSLDWTPRHGTPQHYVGPVPPRLRRGWVTPQVRRMLVALPGTYLLFAAAGAVLGWLAAGPTNRAGSSFGGGVLGFAAAYLLLLALRPVLKRRLDSKTPRPGPTL
jgi:hypothetical protein